MFHCCCHDKTSTTIGDWINFSNTYKFNLVIQFSSHLKSETLRELDQQNHWLLEIETWKKDWRGFVQTDTPVVLIPDSNTGTYRHTQLNK